MARLSSSSFLLALVAALGSPLSVTGAEPAKTGAAPASPAGAKAKPAPDAKRRAQAGVKPASRPSKAKPARAVPLEIGCISTE